MESGIVPDVIDTAPKNNAEVRNSIMLLLPNRAKSSFLIGPMEYTGKVQRYWRKYSYTHDGKACGVLLRSPKINCRFKIFRLV